MLTIRYINLPHDPPIESHAPNSEKKNYKIFEYEYRARESQATNSNIWPLPSKCCRRMNLGINVPKRFCYIYSGTRFKSNAQSKVSCFRVFGRVNVAVGSIDLAHWCCAFYFILVIPLNDFFVAILKRQCFPNVITHYNFFISLFFSSLEFFIRSVGPLPRYTLNVQHLQLLNVRNFNFASVPLGFMKMSSFNVQIIMHFIIRIFRFPWN